MVKRLEQVPSMHRDALMSALEKQKVGIETVPTQRSELGDLADGIQRLNETLTKLEERVNHIYIPKDGDTPFDVSNVAVVSDAWFGIPNLPGTQRTVYSYTPPLGQRLVIQSYEFLCGRTNPLIPAGLDFMWINTIFSNQLRINNQNSIYSEFTFYAGVWDWPLGILQQADRFAFNSMSPGTDSQRNICNNIIVPGGSKFDWVIIRDQVDPLPPLPIIGFMFARFRGYLSTDFSGRKDRK